MTDADDGPTDVEPALPDLKPWDRRVVRSMLTADAARTGALLLRVIAGLIAGATIVGNLLYILSIDSSDSSTIPFDDLGVPARLKLAWFLQNVASPLAFAALVLAASFLVAVYAARLDLDIVQADEDEYDREHGSTM